MRIAYFLNYRRMILVSVQQGANLYLERSFEYNLFSYKQNSNILCKSRKQNVLSQFYSQNDCKKIKVKNKCKIRGLPLI